jgi:hypothetical protein
MPSILDVVSTSPIKKFSNFNPFWSNELKMLDKQSVFLGRPGIGDKELHEIVFEAVAALSGRSIVHESGDIVPILRAHGGDQIPELGIFFRCKLTTERLRIGGKPLP